MIAVLAAIALISILWTNRSIAVTVDGTPTDVRVNSTLEAVYKKSGSTATPGNHVAVNGDVITEGGGMPFSATVNGNQVPDDQLAGYHVSKDDDIQFSDGTDTTEEYDVTDTKEQDPKLKMEGADGTIFYVKQWGKKGVTETRQGKESGKTATVEAQAPQDAIVERAYPKPDNDQKLVALTFDDGPADLYTKQYLDIMDKYGVKATFNLIGEQVAEYPEIVKDIASRGHQVASHTWDHQQLTKLGQKDIQTELDKTWDALADQGIQTSTLRQPYGSINTDVRLYSAGRLSVAAFWSHDSQDWAKPGADAIVANCTADMQPGSIILMHDGGGERDQDVEALPQIIEAWQKAGYKFVTISELMASDSSIPKEITSNYAPLPDDCVWPTEVASDSVDNAIP